MAANVKILEESDGRRRRSQDSRARIIAAMLDLIHGGEVAPGAEQVAERAQVGLRTVFRHFKDMESLYREMSHAIESDLRATVAKPFKGETWRERVLELIDRRSQAYEKIAPFKRASDAHRHHSRFLTADQGLPGGGKPATFSNISCRPRWPAIRSGSKRSTCCSATRPGAACAANRT